MFPFHSYGTAPLAASALINNYTRKVSWGTFLVIIACKNKSFDVFAFLMMKLKTREIKRFT